MNKKAVEPPTLMILIAGIVILAILIILVLVFRQQIGDSGIFKHATDWRGFRWG